MRGFTFRAAPVCFIVFATGCFLTKGETPATDKAPRSANHTYWTGVSAALAQRPAGQDLQSMLNAVRAQTDALRDLPTDGVDTALVAAVNDVVRSEDEVLRLADMTGGNLEMLRQNKDLATTFQTANKRAAEAKQRLRALRESLNERHGGGFAPLAG
jgi:hypothetical protein